MVITAVAPPSAAERASRGEWDLRGLACPYDVWTRDEEDSKALHGGRHVWYAPGAFEPALVRGDARLLIDHREELQLADQANGTLRLCSTAAGLWFEAVLDGSPLADLAIRGVSDGIITGVCTLVTSRPIVTETEIRIHEVDRFDVSLMVSQWSCFYETSVQVHRRLRQRLGRQKEQLYAEMWTVSQLNSRRVSSAKSAAAS